MAHLMKRYVCNSREQQAIITKSLSLRSLTHNVLFIILVIRLMKEFKNYESVPGCGVQPREEDLTIWDAAISCEFGDNQVVPIHMVIQFKEEYPTKAPSVGFSTPFNYKDGASHDERNAGPLFGLFVVCLSILGNYDKVLLLLLFSLHLSNS